jgi:6-phosphogluconolactonase (cycloisomerase 2 family)
VLISGFKINSDGSLLPVPGSPFLLSSPARGVTSAHQTLIVVGDSTLTVLAVDKETGSIQQTDSVNASAAASDLASFAMSASRQAVLDANGRFMYVVDGGKGELAAYQINRGKLALAESYPVPDGTSFITLVQP